MAIILRLIVHKGKVIYDNIYVVQNSDAEREIKEKHEYRNLEIVHTCNDLNKIALSKPFFLRKNGFNAYLISAYISCMKTSKIYRAAAVAKILRFLNTYTNVESGIPTVLLKLRSPKKYFLDYSWNERICRMVLERQEAEYAMSWLSTLGGAFSALGENSQYCAVMAGKISVKQFGLALHLGDPLLVARCKLYAALSLMQLGDLKTPKYMIRKIFNFAIKENDTHLENMCKGLWAKLKYLHKQVKHKRQ